MDDFGIEGLLLVSWWRGFIAGVIAASCVVVATTIFIVITRAVPAPVPPPADCKPRLTGTFLPCIRRVRT